LITKRQQEILKFIVEEYVKTVKTVSSNAICKELNCSSATIRNEMVILEELGYLKKIIMHQEESLAKKDIDSMLKI